MEKLTELITQQQFIASQMNYMQQVHTQITKKASKDIKDLAAKENIEKDIRALKPLADQLVAELFEELENKLAKDQHFRFLPSKRKPKNTSPITVVK